MNKQEYFNFGMSVDALRRELDGLIRGILADDVVVRKEAEYLAKWLDARPDVADQYPFSDARKAVAEALADWGDSPAEILSQRLRGIVGSELGEGRRSSSATPIDPNPEIDFEGCSFCLSGEFAFGPKTEVEKQIHAAGGIVVERLTEDTEYLVVGTVASRAWVNKSFGRKIEKALSMKQAGCDIQIISEDQFFEALPKKEPLKAFDEREWYSIPGKCPTREESMVILNRILSYQPVKQKGRYAWKKGTVLLTTFVDGFAPNWFFKIHGVFAKSLGIISKNPTEKEKDRGEKPYFVQSQGFSFSRGQQIYDTPGGYASPWSEAIKQFSYSIEILMGIPDDLDTQTGERGNGFVEYKLSKVDDGKLVEIERKMVSQADFIRLLIMGPEDK